MFKFFKNISLFLNQEKSYFYTNPRDVEKWLKNYDIKNYEIVPISARNFVVNVNGDVNIKNKNLIKIPIQFGVVNGSFKCNKNQLTSLKGSPKRVMGNFDCSDNQLMTLEYSPQFVQGNFDCVANALETLIGSPRTVMGKFNCASNRLKNLIGSPKSLMKSFCCNNNKINTLQGAPEQVMEDFMCMSNDLTDLNYCPKKIGGDFICSTNKNIKSLKNTQCEVGASFICLAQIESIFYDDIQYIKSQKMDLIIKNMPLELTPYQDRYLKQKIEINTKELTTILKSIKLKGLLDNKPNIKKIHKI